MKKLSIFVLLFSLFLIPGFADAANPSTWDPNQSIEQIVEVAPNPKPDGELAHLWFELMFGKFIWAPWGDTCTGDSCVTVLSKVLSYSNVLALILGVVIAYYVMLGGAINSAHTGEVLGSSWSSVWLPLRSAVGFGLLMPAGAVGGGVMSGIQVLIIWLILLGSNSASVLWTKTADEFASGVPVVATNLSVGMDPAKNVLGIIMCAKSVLESTKGKGQSGRVATVIKHGFLPHKRDYFAHAGSPFPNLSSHVSDINTKRIEFGPDGECGSIGFADMTKDIGDKFVNQFYQKGHVQFKHQLRAAMTSATNLTNTIFKVSRGSGEAILVGLQDNDAKTIADVENWGRALYKIGLDFDIETRRNIKTTMQNDGIVTAWKNKMTDGGWAQAGVWYFEVSRFQGMVSDTINSAFGGIGDVGDGEVCSSLRFWETCDTDNVRNMAAVSVAIADKAAAYGRTKALNKTLDNHQLFTDEQLFQQQSDNQNLQSLADDPDGWSAGITASWSKGILQSLAGGGSWGGHGNYGERCVANQNGFNTGNSSCSYGSSNPFFTVSEIGHTIKNLAVSTWAMMGGGYIIANAIDKGNGLADLLPGNPIGRATSTVSSAIFWALNTMWPMIIGALIQAFVLAFVIPFLPLVTWIFMIAGYLVSVVEAVVAAPLAVVMMVTPEGEGISGTRLERAMSLIAMIVLKPSFMIIGLIASLSLGNILFAVLNQFFWSGVNELTSSGLLELFFVLTLYVATAFKLCQYTVSIMHRLPEQILEWFTYGAARPFGENMASGVAQDAAGGAGKTIQGRATSTIDNLRKQMDQNRASFVRERAREGAKQDMENTLSKFMPRRDDAGPGSTKNKFY